MVIVPGVLASIIDYHIQSLVSEAEAKGYDWVIFNYRGVYGPLQTPKPMSFNDIINFKEPLQNIIQQNNQSKSPRQIFLVGLSLGGNIAFNLLNE